jgi:hypothetical protein
MNFKDFFKNKLLNKNIIEEAVKATTNPIIMNDPLSKDVSTIPGSGTQLTEKHWSLSSGAISRNSIIEFCEGLLKSTPKPFNVYYKTTSKISVVENITIESKSFYTAIQKFKNFYDAGVVDKDAIKAHFKKVAGKDTSYKTNKILESGEPLYISISQLRVANIISGTGTLLTGKAKTNILTECKERVSLMLIEASIENKTINADDIKDKLKAIKPSLAEYYDPMFYTSALDHVKVIKNFFKESGIPKHSKYLFEMQGEGINNLFYEYQKKCEDKVSSKDNWNPADVWLIANPDDVKDKIKAVNKIKEKTQSSLNTLLVSCYEAGEVIPISLKQIEAGETGKFKTSNYKQEYAYKVEDLVDEKFDIQKIKLSSTFANGFIASENGFELRIGLKSSNTTGTVSLEGSYSSSKHQLGGGSEVIHRWLKKEYINLYKKLKMGNNSVANKDIEKEYNKCNAIIKKLRTKYSTSKGFKVKELPKWEDFKQDANNSKEHTARRIINMLSYMEVFAIDLPSIMDPNLYMYKVEKTCSKEYEGAGVFVKFYGA